MGTSCPLWPVGSTRSLVARDLGEVQGLTWGAPRKQLDRGTGWSFYRQVAMHFGGAAATWSDTQAIWPAGCLRRRLNVLTARQPGGQAGYCSCRCCRSGQLWTEASKPPDEGRLWTQDCSVPLSNMETFAATPHDFSMADHDACVACAIACYCRVVFFLGQILLCLCHECKTSNSPAMPIHFYLVQLELTHTTAWERFDTCTHSWQLRVTCNKTCVRRRDSR